MLQFNDSELRAQVTQDFERFASEITDAEEMNRFVHAVVTTTVGTVREKLSDFNEQSPMARIPPEVLAACFAHLRLFIWLIRATHVCRSWRAAALSDPALWYHIRTWSPANRPELIRMALSRAGALPVYLKIDSRAPVDPEGVYTAIAPFSRQIRYLAWHCDQPTSSWEFPAPMMEYFCSGTTLTLTPGFFGGLAGRLRAMYLQCVHLPAECSALATVTDLSVVLTPREEAESPSTLGTLFDVFPRLEWFQILGMTSLASHMLPAGPAPPSLRELTLQSRSWDYDLTPHYLAWEHGGLQHVSLSQYPGALPNLEHMARGAATLAVQHASDKWATRLMFAPSDAVSHTMSISSVGIANAAALLAAVQGSLALSVRTAKVSHVALQPLEVVLTALPNLEHLFVHVVPKTADGAVYPNPEPHAFVWTPLACLAQLARATRRLRAITLHVWCGDCRTPSYANANDARGLLSQLRALPDGLPPIEIQGFPVGEIAAVDLTGLNVRFDVVAKVGGLILHERREVYYPF
ncbi:hypothetical protein AURDEDRAFT_187247 [Auricularia subglabra TFB-10046 SS5]|uniref:F-box domain-containing protein n=1 Tax=Auricularia subglabra (strain TFB-10046 / SS5) TaxID=717982 RepID=J0WXM9_AURST|nr:hypothetical protein AURDEDRAFT_187247 [Auricularia subglabra TFB-10046 SS5]